MLADAARAGAGHALGAARSAAARTAHASCGSMPTGPPSRAQPTTAPAQRPSIRTAPPTSSTRRAPPAAPKGVVVTHRGMLNHLAAKAHDLRLGPQDVVAQTASQCFDISVWQFLVAFLVGGRVHVSSDDVAADPRRLLEQTAAGGVTILESRSIIPARGLGQCSTTRAWRRCKWPPLRWLVVDRRSTAARPRARLVRAPAADPAGQRLRPDRMLRRRDASAHASTRTGSIRFNSDRPPGAEHAALRARRVAAAGAGRRAGRAVTWRAPGSARGYLERSGADVADASWPTRSARPAAACTAPAIWRAGVRTGCWSSSAAPTSQVKIRGFRIEPGEIEAALTAASSGGAGGGDRARGSARQQAAGRLCGAGRGAAQTSCAGPTMPGSATSTVGEWAALFDETYRSGRVGKGRPSSAGTAATRKRRSPRTRCASGSAARSRGLRRSRPAGCWRSAAGSDCCCSTLRRSAEPIAAPTSRRRRSPSFGAGSTPQRATAARRACATRRRRFRRHGSRASFDTVILNSVVQYFPDVDYLMAVLEQAVELVSSGGRVFVGDIRHLGLLPVFHASVQLAHAPPRLSIEQLKDRIARAIAHEKELVIDPDFFWPCASVFRASALSTFCSSAADPTTS